MFNIVKNLIVILLYSSYGVCLVVSGMVSCLCTLGSGRYDKQSLLPHKLVIQYWLLELLFQNFQWHSSPGYDASDEFYCL